MGIGTTTPDYKLDVEGGSSAGTRTWTTGGTYALVAINDSTSTSTRYGVYARSRGPNSRAVFGYANNATGRSYGGFFQNTSKDGVGVYITNKGEGRNEVALRVTNTKTGTGMATYMTSNSKYATGHFSNGGTGQVLYLTNGGAQGAGTGGGNFIEARSENESDLQFRVTTTGQVRSDHNFIGGGADYADMMAVVGDVSNYEPGDVLALAGDAQLALSDEPNSTTVIGVYSTQPAMVGDPLGLWEGDEMPRGERAMLEAIAKDRAPVAMAGMVPVKVTAENGPIAPGDLLTTSSTPGHAMKAEPVSIDGVNIYRQGTIIGKAMTSLNDDEGVIEMLVMMQ